MYNIMPSAKSESFTYFQSRFFFISFSFLIAVTRTLKTVLKNSGKNGYPFLLLDLRGNTFSFLLLNIIYHAGLLYMAFIMLMYVPSMLTFRRVFFFFFFFNHKWVLNFVKSFLCIYWEDYIVFTFQFVNMDITLICVYWGILASLG